MSLDRQSVVRFSAVHQVLNLSCKCPKCLSIVELNDENQFKCDKNDKGPEGNPARCHFQVSGLKDTWLEESSLGLDKVLLLCWCFTSGRMLREGVASAVGVPEQTVNDWYSRCWDVVVHHVESTGTRIGGPDNKVVEIAVATLCPPPPVSPTPAGNSMMDASQWQGDNT
ncbi:uncharacterized protein [Macrobrachium rosenbergii]|uniref:uncharacterized protein n=1 Tax=Macrobrachium rosenbergii TaxID=79674 RepID=UPI0034D7A601